MTRKPKRAAKKRRIRIDVSDWDTGDWEEQFWKAMKIEKGSFGLEISWGSDVVEPIVKNIIKESLETYINDANWYFSKKGLEVCDINFAQEFTIPMNDLNFEGKDSIDAMMARIEQHKKEYEDDFN